MKICRLGLLGQPTLLEGRLVLGMALSALGRHDEVLQEMRVALESDPQSALGWLMKSEALAGKGDFGQAEVALGRARALDPTNPKVDQVGEAIERARASGVEEVPIESTGTKEYPARGIAGVKWRSAPSLSLSEPTSVSDAAAPERELRTEQFSAPTQRLDGPTAEVVVDNAQHMGDTARELIALDEEAEEMTAVDPGPTQNERRPVLPITVVAPPESALLASIKPRPQSGPEEATVAGAPLLAAADPSAEVPVARHGDRPTRELAVPPSDQQLPSEARPAVAPRIESSASVQAEARRRQQVTREEGRARGSQSETNLRAPPSSADPRVTKQVPALDDEPRGFARSSSDSDPPISLDSSEVVFAPPADDSIELTLPPRGVIAPDDPTPQPAYEVVEEAPLEDASREDPRPRSAPEPAPRGRKASHLMHGEAPAHPAEPHGSRRPPSVDPIRPAERAQPSQREPGLLTSALDALQIEPRRGRRNWLALGGILAAVIATGVIAGLVVREWRLRTRVERRHELALKKLSSGSYAGYQAAEVLYRQILAERDDRRAALQSAKVLAQLAFEFGEPPEPAQRALQALGNANPADTREARIYLALAKGELDLAAREAAGLLRERPGPQARYLVGQSQLLLDHADDAANALRSAAEEDAQNPIMLHALGLAEAALRRPDSAFEAFGRALAANASHVATIIDRALLQLRLGVDREAAAGSLEGVVGKLVGDASPGQLARAYVGLAEIELQKGNVAAARSALSSAAARRRDHPLLLEELAKAYADAFELDPAEREAKRALALSGRLQPRLVLAEVALRRSRPVQALTVLEESGSSRPEALVLRALAKLELGRNAEARADAELATHLDASLIQAGVALARVDIGEGRYDAAQRRLEALEAQGKHAEVANALGQVYLAQRMPDRARTFFRQALVRQPLLLEARLALARLLHEAGQLTEARDEVNRILATNAAYVPARRELAALALDLGDSVAARDEFDALAEREPDVDTLLGAARAHLLLGDARGAEDRADRALRLRPAGAELESAYATKVRALLLDHRANEAIQLLLKVVRTAARGELPALFIEAYLDFGRVDWAERAIDVAPVAARTGVELTLAKARLALVQGRQEAALVLAEEAQQRLRSRRSPVWLRAQALALTGQAELELGQARAASKSLRSALELDPRNAHAQHELGLAYLEQKRLEDAAGAFESAIASDARFPAAHYYLGWTRRSLGDARADESLRAYVELEPKGALADDARRMLRGGEAIQTSDQPRSHRRRR